MLPSILPFLLLHLVSSLTHAASPPRNPSPPRSPREPPAPRIASPSQANSIHHAIDWGTVQCSDTDPLRDVLPGSASHNSFARDCFKALDKLPPHTIFHDDFLIPTVIHEGNCAVSIKRIPPEDTSQPDNPAVCMHAYVWKHVKVVGRAIVATCVTQRQQLSGHVLTETKCEDGRLFKYGVYVRVATREDKARAAIYLDRTPQWAPRPTRSPPRQPGGSGLQPDTNDMDFWSLFTEETMGF